MAVIPVTSGLQLLQDARTITGLADAANVSAWADSSGQGNNAAQGTALNQPAYRTNVFGSNPAVRFSAERQHLFGTFASWGTHTGQTLLLCVNNVPTTQTGSGRFLSTSTNTSEDYQNHLIYNSATNGDLNVFCNGTVIKSSDPPVLLSSGISAPTVIGFAVDGTSLSYVCNGVIGKKTHSAGLPGTPTKFSYGYINNGTPSTSFGAIWDCHFAAIFKGKLTDAQVNQVCCWMLQEIGALPAASSGGGSLINSQQLVRQGWIS